MQFQDELAGGVVLIRPALQSPDYVAGASGWTIRIDGSAEFNNVTIRGSGTADPLVVGPDGMPQVIVRTTPTNGLIVFPTNRPLELDAATVNSAVIDPGGPAERAELEITGPTVDGATGGVRAVLRSQPQDGTLPAEFSVQDRTGATTFFAVDDTEVRVVDRRIDSRQQATNSLVLTAYLPPDVADRLAILASGEIQMGPGDAPRDVALWREGPAQLTTQSIVRVYRTAAGANALSLRVVGDTSSRLFVNADGAHNWGPGGAAATDTTLYRSAAGELTTDGDLVVGGSLTAGNLAAGTAQTPAPGAAPAQTSVAVAFPFTFPAVPVVVATPNSASANLDSTNIRWSVTGKSTSGFTINCWRDTNFTTNFEWFAFA